MKNFKAAFTKALSLNVIFLLLLSVYRLIFFTYYGKNVDLSGFGFDILRAFYMGCRFDLSVVASVNAPLVVLFVLLFITGKQSLLKPFFAFLKYYYTAFIGVILALCCCVDFYFYAYFQDHLNILVFGFIEDDTKALIKTFYENYNLFLIGCGISAFSAAVFFVSKTILKLKNYTFRFPNLFFRLLISVALAFSVFLMMRGTVGLLPISQYSNVSSNDFLNKTALNCVFNLGNAVENKIKVPDVDYIAKTGYENNIRQAFADFLGKDINAIPEEKPERSLVFKTSINKKIENLKPNVILIVMESFGNDLMKYNSERFNVFGELKKHFDEDIVFHNFSSEGTITIEAIEATFLNTRRRPNSKSLTRSKYAYKQYQFSTVTPYKQSGYETFFLYGGNASWHNAGTFALNLGFDKVLSGDLINKNFAGNAWGVYDEYLFDLVFETLSQGDNNKFIYALTTTNHPPYTLPQDYRRLPLEIPKSLKDTILNINRAEQRFATYQYSNEMLGRFISKIKNSKYADNTIIAVTGDHNFSNAYQMENFFDVIRVPLYLYIPKSIRSENINTDVFGSHLDIMPTLYNLSLSNSEYMSEGTDLLSKNAMNNVMHYGNYILDKNYAVNDDIFKNNVVYYTFDNEHNLVVSNKKDEHKKLLKRFLSTSAIADYLIKKTGN
ncbi:phosphoglycerol transferase [Endomicrobiia bacterium]|nr:phosphoglycerol transferase [Endomicrobiia bacterium]GHT73349.1 phosphoglycerol transferase [Endomicrobiia bacterium]